MFESLKPVPGDPILGLMAAFRADNRAHKIDLGVGVYQDRLDSPERRFKAFGLFCADPQNASCALCHKDPPLCPPQQNIDGSSGQRRTVGENKATRTGGDPRS